MLRPSIEEIQCPVDGQPHTAVGPCHMYAHSVRTFQFGAPGQIDTCSLDQQGRVGSWSFQGADLLALESPRTTDLILLLSLEHAGGGSVSFAFSLSRNVCRLRSSAFRKHRASLAEAHMCSGSGGNALASSGFLLCRHQVGTPGTLMFQPRPERLRGRTPAEPPTWGLTCASRCPDASFPCILRECSPLQCHLPPDSMNLLGC